ncbi:hypothetical protein DFH07DRAFT_773662 [Mycena maculata]|uniref:Uncharacterized protein n=1 Tax=Mycena maculata TaxID=230809 RepID=A0AAD7J163_9AGAR|nr:hypothetical protein DFH07DRAFT_773662 [Mycena maculata]
MDDQTVVDYQRSSSELVVYSRTAEQVVTVSWPTSKGNKIVPSGLRQFLRLRGLFWECFCAFGTDTNEPRSCQIVVSACTKIIWAFCHYDEPRCRFKLNLTKIYGTSLLTSSYGDLPTLRDRAALRRVLWGTYLVVPPPAQTNLAALSCPAAVPPTRIISFTCSLAPPSNRNRHGSPYLRLQREIPTSNPRYVEIDDLPGRQVQTAPARLPGNAVAGPSRISPQSASYRAPFPRDLDGDEMKLMDRKERKYLHKLLACQGITEDAWGGLTEQCKKCKHILTCSALKEHVEFCLGEAVLAEYYSDIGHILSSYSSNVATVRCDSTKAYAADTLLSMPGRADLGPWHAGPMGACTGAHIFHQTRTRLGGPRGRRAACEEKINGYILPHSSASDGRVSLATVDSVQPHMGRPGTSSGYVSDEERELPSVIVCAARANRNQVQRLSNDRGSVEIQEYPCPDLTFFVHILDAEYCVQDMGGHAERARNVPSARLQLREGAIGGVQPQKSGQIEASARSIERLVIDECKGKRAARSLKSRQKPTARNFVQSVL